MVGRGQCFLRWQLQVPPLGTKMIQYLLGVLHRQLAVLVQLHLHHEPEFTQHQGQ